MKSGKRLSLTQEEKQSIASCSPCVVLADKGKEADVGRVSDPEKDSTRKSLAFHGQNI